MLLAGMLALALSSCGGEESDGGSSSTRAPDACLLLGSADAEDAVGGAATASGEVAEDGLFSTCTWVNNTSGVFMTLSIWASNTADEGWAEEFLATQSSAPGTTQVSGVGSDAYYRLDGRSSILAWRNGPDFVVVLNAAGTELTEAELTALGRTVDEGL